MGNRELNIVGDYLWDRTFARSVDRFSSDEFGIPAAVLMELAGRGVAQAILDAGVDESPIIVLAGRGNNGGDALVAARWLFEAGCDVHIFRVDADSAGAANPAESPLCAAQLRILKTTFRPINIYRRGCLSRFNKAEPIIIDGVLGIGFSGALNEDQLIFQALTEASHIPGSTVVAVDIPSGLDADSGDTQNVPLPAELTITFGGRKPAHVLAPARDCCGEVLCLDIGFPGAAQESALAIHTPQLVMPEADALIEINPWEKLPRSAHKYDRGHVLIIGGSAGKTGATLLAALSALRSGAGWVSVAMPESALASLKGDVPRELVFEKLFDGERLNAITLEKFLTERKVKAVVAGPGSVINPLEPESLATLADFTTENDGFVVLDAGATHGFAALTSGIDLDLDPERWLLTPHPGEWRHIGEEFAVSPLTPAGLKHASSAAERLGVAILYKHATPVLVTGNPKTPGFVLNEGSLILARAGTGDLLAGAAGAHGAIGLGSVVAALRSQVVIAWAANLAADAKGRDAVLARDILEQIGNVPSVLEEEDEEELGDE